MWTDTHCHLDAAAFDADRAAVVDRARDAGVGRIVLPAVDRGNFETVRALAHRHDLSYALGIHPLCVDAAADEDLDVLRDALATYRDDPALVAVGEIGLDHFVPGLDPARQARFCTAQLRMARDFGLPVLLHTRRAADPMLKLLRQTPAAGGIAHAFNGSPQQADAYASLGLALGFGGAMTFERALRIRHLAATLPLASIVLETDAPDIPPQWIYRRADARARAADAAQGRNEPAELPRIAETLAALRGMGIEDVAIATSANARAALPRMR
jgi:TatD DNase family protein